MGIHIDMTGVTVQPEPIPPGYYASQVTEVKQEVSAKGNPYLAWRFRITEGEVANRIAFYNTSLQAQALWNLKRTLIALGFDEEELATEIDLDPSTLVGLDAGLVVEEDEYEGRTTSRVVQVIPIDELGAMAEAAEEIPL